MNPSCTLTPHMRERLIRALSGAPAVIAGLTTGLAPDDERWDRRPYADRFSLREVMAHLADWDRIYVDRLILMRDRPGSPLTAYDEERLAIVHDYGRAAPRQSLRRLTESRRAMIHLLLGLTGPQWANTGVHPDQGTLSIDLHASCILMHDGYHTQQVAEWMSLPE